MNLAKELSGKLWDMANTLRGTIDASEFKNYILGMLCYKYLSEETFKTVKNVLFMEDSTNEEVFKEWEENEDWCKEQLLLAQGCFIDKKYLFDKLIEKINNDTFSIEDLANGIDSFNKSFIGFKSEESFKDMFEDLDLTSSKLGKTVSAKNKIISELMIKIYNLTSTYGGEEDVLGTAYMILISNFASSAGKKGGEFYTPASMSKLLTEIATVGLESVRTCLDPTCGSGSLLLNVKQKYNDCSLYGQELTSSTYNLARMNMILHGIKYDKFNLKNMNTIEEMIPTDFDKFDVCVANPPYSAKWHPENVNNTDPRYASYGKFAPASKADLAFVQHILHLLKNGDSRAAVLLPHGVLFRGSSEENIRKYIIEKLNKLDAVIGLPSNCFYGTNIPVCLLVLKNDREENKDNICFIDASKEFVSGKSMNYITDEHIDKIVKTYMERKEVDKYCHIASMDEIIENDYNLNIPRYVDTFEEEEPIDIPTVKANIAKHMEESKAIDAELEDYFKQLGI